MRVSLYIYIDSEVRRIDTFQDEKISVVSSIQNINDISKIFTDYSQSFNVPASPNNNAIFSHWYENAVDSGYDQRLRYDGYIEIGTEVFRIGRWQIESATVKNGRVEDYKLTFFGLMRSLSDKFGKDNLADIQELNDYTINYSASEVIDRVEDATDNDLMFPLISSSRAWSYNGGTEDISVSGTGIVYTELFPALRVSKIFDAIESKYGVTFTGNFLTQSRFTDAYLWLKNKESFITFTDIVPVNFTSKTADIAFFTGSTTTESITYVTRVPRAKLTCKVVATGSWILYVYKNGIEIAKLDGNATQTHTIFDEQGNAGANVGTYTFGVQMQSPASFTTEVVASYILASATFDMTMTSASQSTTAAFDLRNYMPDMKVADFFSGILKMFNLTSYSLDGITYTIEQLEDWYAIGEVKDFTQYAVTDLEIERIKSFKKIDFSYQKSESILNRAFANLFSREYGDLNYTFTNDGSDYQIQLPFENILFQRFTGSMLQVGYSLKPDLNPYIPKPVILYKYGNVPTSVVINNGSTDTTINSYNVFGQDVIFLGLNQTLNWGLENSSLLDAVIPNSLFNNYYLLYLNNLYALKSRLTRVTFKLPFIELISLKLNDRIVIRDKRYIINQFTTDLDTFEVKAELLQDFRDAVPTNVFSFTIDEDADTHVFDKINNGGTWSIDEDTDNMIDTITDNGATITVVVFANALTTGKSAVLVSDLGDTIYITQTTDYVGTSYNMSIANTGGTLATCCAQTDYTNVYFSRNPKPEVGDTVYTTNALSTVYNGGNLYHVEDVTGDVYRITTTGIISNKLEGNCI